MSLSLSNECERWTVPRYADVHEHIPNATLDARVISCDATNGTTLHQRDAVAANMLCDSVS